MDLLNSLPQIAKDMHKHIEMIQEVDEALFSLWTWLPLYEKMRRYHGDYVPEHQPTTASLIEDACRLMAYLHGYDSEEVERDMDLDDNAFECPCGEYHSTGSSHRDWEYHKQDAVMKIAKLRAVHEAAKKLR